MLTLDPMKWSPEPLGINLRARLSGWSDGPLRWYTGPVAIGSQIVDATSWRLMAPMAWVRRDLARLRQDSAIPILDS